MDFSFLEMPMKLPGENIDPRYFIDNGDGTYTATPLLKYKVGKNAQKFFRYMIERLDVDNNYFKYVKGIVGDREVKDDYTNNQLKEKYADAFEKIEKRFKEEYMPAHPDEFEEIERIATGDHDENKFTAAFRPDMTLSLEDALSGYLAATELVDKYGNGSDNYNSISRYTFKQGKREFWDAHNKIKESWYAEYGLPDPQTFKRTKFKPNTRFSGKQVEKDASPNEDLVKEYAKEFCEYLTESNAMEFKAKAEEMDQLISKDFEVKFDDSSKFKADKLSDGTIEVFTLPTIDEDKSDGIVFSAGRKIKLIVLEPNDEDSFDYTFEIKTDEDYLRYVKSITTKTDLLKAIKNSLNMTQDIKEFKKYFDELQEIYNKL